MYKKFLSTLDNLGFGRETSGNSLIHIPMAYGTLAMAAAIHGDKYTACEAADWLCSNSTSTLKTGWGLNWEWDSFAKGSINPANTIYGVTVAIAVDGLFRTYLLTRSQCYLDTALMALQDYAEQHTYQQDQNSIFFHYSDQPADHFYRVPNITAMLMAQYATVGAAVNNSEFIDLSIKAFRGLVNDMINAEDGVCWNYICNSENKRSNDLIHAAFIVYGIYLFAKSDICDMEVQHIIDEAVVYLLGFVKDGIIYENSQSDNLPSKNPRARSWAVGMLLFVAKTLGKSNLVEQVQAVIPDYEFAPGQFSYRYGDKLHSPRSVAFLLLGSA